MVTRGCDGFRQCMVRSLWEMIHTPAPSDSDLSRRTNWPLCPFARLEATELMEEFWPTIEFCDCVECSVGFSMMPLGSAAGVPSDV
jgi:hypothetical protein